MNCIFAPKPVAPIMSAIRPFAVVAALLLSAFASPAQGQEPSASSDAQRAVREFYSWYVPQVLAEKNPFEKGRAQLQRSISTRFLRAIDKAQKDEGGIGADPFLNAQDVDNAWAKNITVSSAKVQGPRATVEVALKGREMSVKLHVTAIEEQGHWKIDKVEDAK